jgi:ubiquitin C-terminal hydrolase
MAKTPKRLIVELNVFKHLVMDARGVNYPKYWL